MDITTNSITEYHKDKKNLRFMKTTIPSETQNTIISALLLMLEEHQKPRIHAQKIRHEINFDKHIFLNGLVRDNIPTHLSWKRAYMLDKDCSMMIDMLNDPASITKENLEKIHFVYRSPMRNPQISYKEEKLHIRGPIINSN